MIHNPAVPQARRFDPLGRLVAWSSTRLEPGPLDRLLAWPPAWAAAIALVAALQAWLILGHDAWLDEWQALAIAVQSPTLHELFANLAYEGHPAPWYLLLRGLAAVLPDPRSALAIAALVLALVTQATILFVAPFARLERLLIALSQFVLFEFLTVSRSLTLGACVTVLTAALWSRRRLGWLAIAFLPQCDFLFGVLAIGFVFLRWRERCLWWPGIVLFGASSAFAAWTVHSAPDMVPAIAPFPPLLGIAAWVIRACTVGFPLQWFDGHLTWNAAVPALGVPVGAVLLLGAARQELRSDRDRLLVFVGFVAVTFVFSVAIYPLAARHMFLIALLLIVLPWLRLAAGGPQSGRMFRAWLAAAAVCGLVSAAISARMPFDAGRLAAQEMVRQGLTHKPWVALRKERGPGIAALTGMAIQPYGDDCVGSFLRWNRTAAPLDRASVQRWLGDRAARNGRFWLVSEAPIAGDAHAIRLLARFPAGYNGIGYFLYDVRPDLPEAKPPARRCDGPVRPLFGIVNKLSTPAR